MLNLETNPYAAMLLDVMRLSMNTGYGEVSRGDMKVRRFNRPGRQMRTLWYWNGNRINKRDAIRLLASY